jgi:hypothetical protein
MANQNLGDAKKAKYDEFYTQYQDIEKEMNAYLEYDRNVFKGKVILLPCDDPEWSNFTKYFAQNFAKLGLKKLISTSFAADSKPQNIFYQPTIFEVESPQFDETKTKSRGKIFTLSRDNNEDSLIDFNDIEWTYLAGSGDFKSEEIRKLRDESDVIITNPPFSLFRDFLEWILEANKKFVILGNMNAVTSKEIFPLIRHNKVWFGVTRTGVGSMWFGVTDNAPDKTGQKIVDGKRFQTVGSSAWYTNLDHGRRHQPIPLMNMEDNIKFSKHPAIRNSGYKKYDNYNAIDVSFTDSIPSDFEGAMGVPISFLSKYNPDQFEILDANDYREEHQSVKSYGLIKDASGSVDGVNKYVRVLIRHRGNLN